MTCLNPKYVWFSWYNKIDERTGEVFRTKQLHFKNIWDKIDEETEVIPCGQCEGCQIDKANDWATRAFLEAQNHTKNAFLTLTYDNEHLNKHRSLCKSDLQKFWKRLRKKIEPQKILYLACGEYGPKTLRPHYHAAVFGYWPDDAKPYKTNEAGDMLYTSQELSKAWGLGFVILGNLTYESAAYIARYVFKKSYGGDLLPIKKNKTPEYITCSKRPAIAKNFFLDKKKWEKIIRNNGILIPSRAGTKIKPIPQYFKKKWRDFDHENYYFWQEQVRKNMLKSQENILSKTDKNFAFYRRQKSEQKKESFKRLDKFRNNVVDLS